MTLEMFVTWMAVGIATGWVGGIVMKDGGHGRFWDVLLGLAGSGVATTIAMTLAPEPGMGAVAMLAVAFGGAALVIGAQRAFGPASV